MGRNYGVRCGVRAAVFKGFLMVAGGKNKNNFPKYEETYSPAINKWQQITKLNQHRIECELLSCIGCLYVVGGNDKSQMLSSMEMERLKDLNGKWEFVAPMNESRATFAVVSYQGEIYAILLWQR